MSSQTLYALLGVLVGVALYYGPELVRRAYWMLTRPDKQLVRDAYDDPDVI